MSFGKKKSRQESTTVQTPELDPLARQALEGVLGASENLFDPTGARTFTPTDPATIAGLQALQDRPQSPFIQIGGDRLGQLIGGDFAARFNPALSAAQDQLQSTLRGDVRNRFFGASNPALGAVEQRIFDTVGRGVRDQFGAVGRGGSPAEELAFRERTAQAISPILFQQFENQQNLASAERARQIQAAQLAQAGALGAQQQALGAFGFIPTLETAQDAFGNRLFNVGQAIQAENQRAADAPFVALERFVNPTLSAVGGFPVTLTRQTDARGRQSGFELGLF